jgi:hypothetical protein
MGAVLVRFFLIVDEIAVVDLKVCVNSRTSASVALLAVDRTAAAVQVVSHGVHGFMRSCWTHSMLYVRGHDCGRCAWHNDECLPNTA